MVTIIEYKIRDVYSYVYMYLLLTVYLFFKVQVYPHGVISFSIFSFVQKSKIGKNKTEHHLHNALC